MRAQGNHPHHPLHYWLQRAEKSSDFIVIALTVALGLVMLIGLITAQGNVTWQ